MILAIAGTTLNVAAAIMFNLIARSAECVVIEVGRPEVAASPAPFPPGEDTPLLLSPAGVAPVRSTFRIENPPVTR